MLLAITLLSANLIYAAEEPGKNSHPKQLHFFHADDIQSIVDRLAPAPAPLSPTDRADLKTMLETQNKRTKEGCNRAKKEAEINLGFYAQAAPTLFKSEQIDKEIDELIYDVAHDAQAVISVSKKKWNRTRPWARNIVPKLVPCPGMPRPHDTAYPSGHAAHYWLYGRILSSLTPSQQEQRALMGFAKQAGDDRVLCGVHHPSDVAAGQKLADMIFAQLKMNPSFANRLNELKAQVQKLYPQSDSIPSSPPVPKHG